MKQNKLLLAALVIGVLTAPVKTIASEASLLNSQHMKQYNIFEKSFQPSQLVLNLKKDKFYTINNIIFEKNEAFSDQTLKELIDFSKAERFSDTEIINMKNSLTEFYDSNGYKSSVINFSIPQDQSGTIIFTIYEGPKNKIDPNKISD